VDGFYSAVLPLRLIIALEPNKLKRRFKFFTMTNDFLSIEFRNSKLSIIEAKLNQKGYHKSLGLQIGLPPEGEYHINRVPQLDPTPQLTGLEMAGEGDFLWSINIHMKSEDLKSDLRTWLLYQAQT
jgi:hypothetical protein